MRLPRDISADELIAALHKFGYTITRQKGSHIRLTTLQDGEHHETIPHHDTIKIATLKSILRSVAQHHHISIDELLHVLQI